MSVREVKLTEVDTRIENEIGLLRTSSVLSSSLVDVADHAFARQNGGSQIQVSAVRFSEESPLSLFRNTAFCSTPSLLFLVLVLCCSPISECQSHPTRSYSSLNRRSSGLLTRNRIIVFVYCTALSLQSHFVASLCRI